MVNDVDVEPETVLIPGGRDVRASHDRAHAGRDAAACVVACPPHPEHGGTRHNGHLQAVSSVLRDRGVDCLRFDYGDWDGGPGELADVEAAMAWARDRYDRVGLFGYSFGGCLALVAAADADRGELVAVSALAPARRVADGIDAVAAIDRIAVPPQVVYGSRDTTAEWEPVVERARALETGGSDSEAAGAASTGSDPAAEADAGEGATWSDPTEAGSDHSAVSLTEIPADHFFVGQADRVGETIGSWLADRL
ncbi:hypothetical protein SAMN05192561_12313 [Halopenitus malekzadehii]|uniref:Xaa-Pro dipeptidyl-peptidase-like domain-containing protein n=1 Tax=Halopenitus malekzadehii TaxID=1267564 RepID=A0A1H6JTM3_9EURY|nr:hypothetical protein SAMN05192561_12313 [Halopenitus malekzadehii]